MFHNLYSSCLIFCCFEDLKMLITNLFMACVWIVSTASHELFSSTDQVMQLVKEEKYLLKLFSSYVSAEIKHLKKLKSDLQILKLESKDPEKTMSDPAAAFKLIRRLRIDWLYILQSTQISDYEDFQEWTHSDSPKFPLEGHLEGAALELIRLQELYELHPEDIIGETHFSKDEAYHVGWIAYQHMVYQPSFYWFMYSLKMLDHPESSTQGVTREHLQFLASTAFTYGSLSVTIDVDQQLLNLFEVAQFVEVERNLLKLFSVYYNAEKKKLKMLMSDLQTLRLESNSEDPEKTMSDPAAAYKLIRRLRIVWLYILQSTNTSLYEDFQEWLHSNSLKFPSKEDLEGAAVELFRLQEMYKLYPENITNGTHFSEDEAFDVGFIAYQHMNFQHAFHWFLYSLKMLDHSESSSTQGDTRQKLLHYLGSSAYESGSLSVAIHFYQQLLDMDSTSEPDIFTLNMTSRNSYEALCRGEIDQRTSRRQRTLSCRYSTGGGNPRLILAPLKEEDEWNEPRIIRYHDIISDKEIEILKNLSRPQLSRSEIGSGISSYVSNIRVSQSVFLEENDILVDRVNQRIADATGLSMETAEQLHVQNYGIGGRYEPHHDTLIEENDRIATFLIYMSDVEMGGATVFPKVGVALQPKKGSAVFWYNLNKNGTVYLKTQHAGCPVFRGNKWVANKWIHEFGQEFIRPCSLSEWE